MSESEEMYLVTIARLKETGIEGPVPLSLLASELDVLSVSVNQMIRKLEDTGMVTYTPYRGVDLTETGQQRALRVLRYRRLWEVFLVEQLKINQAEAAELACRMEHVLPEQTAERLAEFLGNPVVTVDGKPIPASVAAAPVFSEVPISALNAGQTTCVSRINADATVRSFLASEGILPGREICVNATSSGGAVLVTSPTGRSIHISPDLAQSIWVKISEE